MNETEIIVRQREKERLVEELASLERKEASSWKSILWNALSLLIVEPAVVAGTVWYFWSSIKKIASKGMLVDPESFNNNLKWTAVAFAVMFTLTSLTLLFTYEKLLV